MMTKLASFGGHHGTVMMTSIGELVGRPEIRQRERGKLGVRARRDRLRGPRTNDFPGYTQKVEGAVGEYVFVPSVRAYVFSGSQRRLPTRCSYKCSSQIPTFNSSDEGI